MYVDPLNVMIVLRALGAWVQEKKAHLNGAAALARVEHRTIDELGHCIVEVRIRANIRRVFASELATISPICSRGFKTSVPPTQHP